MKHFLELVSDCLTEVREIMPWDLEERLQENPDLLIVDVREPYEYQAMHIAGSLNVPRGILESACEWDYEETEPELVEARSREVVVVCRSGYRSVLAAHSMQLLGYTNVSSLKTGLRGWKDYEQPLVDDAGTDVDLDNADVYFTPKLRADQLRPAGWRGNETPCPADGSLDQSSVPGVIGVVAPSSERSGALYHASLPCSCTTSPTMISVGGFGFARSTRPGKVSTVAVYTRC